MLTKLIGSSFAALILAAAPAALADGPSVFKAEGCTECHSVSAKGIKLNADGTLEKDLSHIGAKHDKKWIAGVLLQKVDNEKGDKHKKKWRGSKHDLKVLAEWLESLK